MVAASKAVKLSSTDGTSTATTVLQVSNYIRRVFTAPPEVAAIPSFGGGQADPSLPRGVRGYDADRVDNGPGGGGGLGRVNMNYENDHQV